MSDELAFAVPGEPVPKARPRARVVGPFARIYTPSETRRYEQHVRVVATAAAHAARWMWSDRDRFGVTARVFRTYEGKPSDLDNVLKSITDGCNGVAYPDDRRIRALYATLAQDAERPRVEVKIIRFPLGRMPTLAELQ